MEIITGFSFHIEHSFGMKYFCNKNNNDWVWGTAYCSMWTLSLSLNSVSMAPNRRWGQRHPDPACLPAFRALALSHTWRLACFRPCYCHPRQGRGRRSLNTLISTAQKLFVGLYLFSWKSFKKSFRVARENVCLEIRLIWI